MIEYFENDITETDLENLNQLLVQLSPKLKAVNLDRINEVIKGGYIFSARDADKKEKNTKGELIGMATLIPLVKFAGYFGNVEDVIVFEEYRGRGIGKKLLGQIVEKGRALKLEHLFLTSNKKREAARGIYMSHGFEEYDTTPFKLVFDKDKI